MISRRGFITATGAALTALPFGARAALPGPGIPVPPAPVPIPDLPPLIDASPANFSSPPLRRCLAELPRIGTRPASTALTARTVEHRYHPDLPATTALGYTDDSHTGILGPTLVARRGAPDTTRFAHAVTAHPLADAVDPTMRGASDRDRTDPPLTVHLHGAPSHPDADGNPVVVWHRGGEQVNSYANAQEAATLWYHDHAMAITRLNVQAGLAGFYLLRDEFDTGEPGNPLGLPVGEFEVPLVIQDRTFHADGSLQPRLARYQPEGRNQLGQFGDVAVVNGVAWPKMTVRRGLYRLRILQGANSRTVRLPLSDGSSFQVIGKDQGLLDAPVTTDAVTLTSGERVDLLVDFSRLAPGQSVELINTAPNSVGNTMFMIPTLREIMRFDAAGPVVPGPGVPARLRGGPGLPAPLPPADPAAADAPRG